MTQPLDYRRVSFLEEQRFPQWWFGAFCYGMAALAALGGTAALAGGALFPSNARDPRLLSAGIALFAACYLIVWVRHGARLVTSVDADALTVGVRPLAPHQFPLTTIASAEVRGYDVWRDHGCRGSVRLRDGSGWAYTAFGSRGVAVTLSSGECLFIGSQRAEELAAAILERLPAANQPVATGHIAKPRPPEGSPAR